MKILWCEHDEGEAFTVCDAFGQAASFQAKVITGFPTAMKVEGAGARGYPRNLGQVGQVVERVRELRPKSVGSHRLT